MNVVCILGSPRINGNSTLLANRFCEKAREKGASVRTFALNKLTYRGCQACMACKKKLERCVLDDDLKPALEAIRDADVLVMASPVYFGEVSSQTKAFIDRTFSYLKADYITNPKPSRLAPGKQLVFILAQGQPDEKLFADVFPRYDMFFQWYGFKPGIPIRACGVNSPGSVERRADILALVDQTADKITMGSGLEN